MDDSEISSASAVNESRAADFSNKTMKRRSLIFQRRSTSHNMKDNFDGRHDDQLLDDENTSKKEDNFDLSSYIVSLKNEREEWKKVLIERKSQRRHLAKQEISIGDECELDLSILTEHERSFILSRPNYHQISKNINDLIPTAVKVAILNTHINHLKESLIESMEEKNIELTKQVTELARK